ncbi:MAG: TIGR04255 family protein, partial [Methylococcaceae bacterium]|nr:TIGR04255 family protein [Methylococcaceae bacterium]
NREKTACFLLLQDALIYQTTQYRGRDAFFAELHKGLEVVHEVVGLDFVERIGLRYLDAVMPGEEETLDQYLAPEVLGLGRKLEGLQHSMVEAVAQLPFGMLVTRAFTVVSQGDHPPMPPELLPLQLVIQPRFSPCDGLITVLDNDCFIQERVAFSLSNIVATLHRLRDGIGLAFERSITQFAQERWK